MGYTSPMKKSQIILLKKQGVPDSKIAERYSVLHRQIHSQLHLPQIHRTDDIHIAVRMLARTQAHDVADLQRQQFLNLHPNTIRKRLAMCGLKAYICHKKPFLSPAHKERQFEWAKAHQHWSGWLSCSPINQNSIYSGQMAIVGVGGSQGRNLMKDM
jgi:hypothetical protein